MRGRTNSFGGPFVCCETVWSEMLLKRIAAECATPQARVKG
jgi:hypothetical protein